MTNIDDIIRRSTNPFDSVASVNFWQESRQPEPIVDSIHQHALVEIEAALKQVIQEHKTRSIVLDGDGGSGKTFLLKRLKERLNSQAFFVYIPPYPQGEYIWRHTLRYMVDSLVQVPEGQTESQLLLWLKEILENIQRRSLKDKVFKDDVLDLVRSDRQIFISKLKKTFQRQGIFNAERFFGVLHDLINPDLFDLACEWLRGDDLSEENLELLHLKKSIDSEDSAQKILANFGKIATNTKPIVLCFDQLDSIEKLPDGSLNLNPLFGVNTAIFENHNNFLVIISITTNTWKESLNKIDLTDKARISQRVSLRSINLDQAKALLAYRLKPLHLQAIPKPLSPIYPLEDQHLRKTFPGGKTITRSVLVLGRKEFKDYKAGLVNPDGGTEPIEDEKLPAAFKLKWQQEFSKVQQRITKIGFLSSPELIRNLEVVLKALQVENVKASILSGTFASYSLSYQLPGSSQKFGIIWTEDANMTTFCNVMKACEKALKNNSNLTLRLIRSGEIGRPKNQGYKLFTYLFTGNPHQWIKPDLTSVQYLETYHTLVRDAQEGDLVIYGKKLGLKDLQFLVRESRVLNACSLLQDLGVVQEKAEPDPLQNQGERNNHETITNSELSSSKHKPPINKLIKPQPPLLLIKEFILNLVITNSFLSRQILSLNTATQFPQATPEQIDSLIQQLCQEKKIKILDPGAKPEEQLVSWIPSAQKFPVNSSQG